MSTTWCVRLYHVRSGPSDVVRPTAVRLEGVAWCVRGSERGTGEAVESSKPSRPTELEASLGMVVAESVAQGRWRWCLDFLSLTGNGWGDALLRERESETAGESRGLRVVAPTGFSMSPTEFWIALDSHEEVWRVVVRASGDARVSRWGGAGRGAERRRGVTHHVPRGTWGAFFATLPTLPSPPTHST